MRRLVARGGGIVPTAPATAQPSSTAAPAPPTPDTPPTTPTDTSAPAQRAAGGATFASVIKVAERSGRTDLSAQLRSRRAELRRTGVTVAIVGEFKKGKSTLLNALVNAEVCPADPVDASVVPVVVRYAEEFAVTTTYGDGRVETAALQPHEIAALAGESGNPANRLGIAHIEVGLRRRLLAAGLTFVDLPGVGGLDSAIGALNLASLESADGVLFVSDCTQELTAPELQFLVAAHDRCPHVACVMTKLDMQPDTAAVLARNRLHLDQHGLQDVALHAVSSVLHLVALAEGDTALEHESGFADLFRAIHEQMWVPARRAALAAAGQQIAELAEHVALPIAAERAALRSPEQAERTIMRLAELEDRVRQLRSAAARWQQRLAEGASDLAGDLDHELRERLRSVARMAEARAEVDTSTDDLEFEAWLHKATMEQIVAHYDRIGERMSALSDEVAEQFVALDRHAGRQVEVAAPTDRLTSLSVSPETTPIRDNVFRRLATTGQGYSSGIVVTSSVLGMIGGAFLLVPAITLPIAALMARRAYVDDRDRRRAARRHELKRRANRYLDEVGFIVHKDARDAIKRLHRELREHYAERAAQLERTVQQARLAALLAAGQPAAPAADTTSLEGDAAAVDRLRRTAARLVAAGSGGAR